MPREYTIVVVLSDDYVDETLTAEEDLKAWQDERVTIEDLMSVATGEPDCSVHFAVRELTEEEYKRYIQ